MKAHDDVTLAAAQSWLASEHGVRLSNGAIWNAVGIRRPLMLGRRGSRSICWKTGRRAYCKHSKSAMTAATAAR
jgi:hypothetical protein